MRVRVSTITNGMSKEEYMEALNDLMDGKVKEHEIAMPTVIHANYQIMDVDLNDPEVVKDIYCKIETAGRNCYKSTKESAEQFVRDCIKRGHGAMLEHADLRVRFIVDRGISHELVRHRLCSFAQESTRYCNYGKDKFGNSVTFIQPRLYEDKMPEWWPLFVEEWVKSAEETNNRYLKLVNNGVPPEWARDILTTSVKTDLIMKANMREWREILSLRAAGVTGKPHPQMLEVMVPLLNELRLKLPALFEDIQPME